jgi:hypothetical protein
VEVVAKSCSAVMSDSESEVDAFDEDDSFRGAFSQSDKETMEMLFTNSVSDRESTEGDADLFASQYERETLKQSCQRSNLSEVSSVSLHMEYTFNEDQRVE